MQVFDHPGGHHYVIHAYDQPPLARQALTVAHDYGDIAPEVPHALHMPTHIFTRLELWQESIGRNKKSSDAALKHPAGDKVSVHYLHALDYLAYAFLQRGEDVKAQQISDTLATLEGPFQVEIATPYTFAAVPARLTLEKQQWQKAAKLEPRQPIDYPWTQFPAIEAITHFTRGLGSARRGDTSATKQFIAQLANLRDEAAKTSEYWAKQVEIQRLSTAAWLAFAQNEKNSALATMQKAAGLEASTSKHPVTPGEVLPAQELLGDMLLSLGHYGGAQQQYVLALERSPGRFNSVYGAARSAELAGHKSDAALYYEKLVVVAVENSEHVRLRKAREYLERSH